MSLQHLVPVPRDASCALCITSRLCCARAVAAHGTQALAAAPCLQGVCARGAGRELNLGNTPLTLIEAGALPSSLTKLYLWCWSSSCTSPDHADSTLACVPMEAEQFGTLEAYNGPEWCLDCVAGKFQVGSSCQDCAPGTWRDASAAPSAACSSCPPGSSSPSGSVAEFNCAECGQGECAGRQ